MPLFINTTGGMKNLPVVIFIPSIGIKILILVFSNKILVFFDKSIRIPRAHARIHKVFYPCNRCHLATLSDNQYVTCGNEVTRVATNADFALKMSEKRVKVPLLPCEAPGFEGRRCRLRGSKVRASKVEAQGFISYYIIRYEERICFVMKVENF